MKFLRHLGSVNIGQLIMWIIVAILMFIVLSFGMQWLVILLLVLIFIGLSFTFLLKKVRPSKLRKILLSTFLLFFSFFIGIFVKVFLLDVYHIPSNSMEDTLLIDDILIVNKLAYGPKLPQNPFEIPWLNLLTFNKQTKSSINESWWPYRRLKGYNKIKSGDILVYQLTKSFQVTKRCVGIPGDTINLKQGLVYINGKLFIEPLTVKEDYQIQISDKKGFYKSLKSLDKKPQMTFDTVPNSFTGNLTKKTAHTIRSFVSVSNVVFVQDQNIPDETFFVDNVDLKWTLNNLGPVVVPRKGMKIALTRKNIALYKKVIERYEGVEINRNDKLKDSAEYTFKQNYYFLLGDNRKLSDDSRIVGFIPEAHIVGKVQCILYSTNKNKFQWNRILKLPI